MTERAELMIGEFARRSRLPVSTLRYYDRIGLLIPASVDPDSGYRRYAVEQLPAAMLVHRLRTLGLAPAGMARVLADGPAALLRERSRIADEVEAGRARLRRLDELLAERTPDDHRVEVVTLHLREVAARAFQLPAAELEAGVTRAIAGLRSALRRAGHRRTGPWGATFPVDLADEVSGFVFAPVDGVRAARRRHRPAARSERRRDRPPREPREPAAGLPRRLRRARPARRGAGRARDRGVPDARRRRGDAPPSVCVLGAVRRRRAVTSS